MGGIPVWMLIVPVIAGAGVAWQQGTNGRLRLRVQSPLAATVVNFAGGTAVLIVAGLVHIAIAGAPRVLPPTRGCTSGERSGWSTSSCRR